MLKRNKKSTELRMHTSILLSVESERIIKRPVEDEAKNHIIQKFESVKKKS